jgi:hypothetical protein
MLAVLARETENSRSSSSSCAGATTMVTPLVSSTASQVDIVSKARMFEIPPQSRWLFADHWNQFNLLIGRCLQRAVKRTDDSTNSRCLTHSTKTTVSALIDGVLSFPLSMRLNQNEQGAPCADCPRTYSLCCSHCCRKISCVCGLAERASIMDFQD